MADLLLKGDSIKSIGTIPEVGSIVPDFTLVTTKLSTKSLSDFKGSRVILNIFPSVDTDTCAQSVREFNEKASKLDNVKVLCISKDLPFALARFCAAEGIDNVHSLSDFRDSAFGKDYNLLIADGPLEGLHSRVVIVLDTDGKVIYNQQVKEISEEPDYEKALAAL